MTRPPQPGAVHRVTAVAITLVVGFGVGGGASVPLAALCCGVAIAALAVLAQQRRSSLFARSCRSPSCSACRGRARPPCFSRPTAPRTPHGDAQRGLRSRLAVPTAVSRGGRCGRDLPLSVFAVGAAGLAGVLTAVQMATVFPLVEWPAPPLWLAAGCVVLAAAANSLCEEMLWRWHLLRLLRRAGVGNGVAVIVQAVSFGAAHAGGLPGGPVGGVAAAVFGCLLGALLVRYGRFIDCILVHLAADLAIFSVLADHLVFMAPPR